MSFLKKRVNVRKLVGVVLAAGLLVSLSACAPTADDTFAGCNPSGNATLVSTSGSFGGDPKSTFPTPLVSKTSELSVASKGDGEKVAETDGVDVSLSIYNGTTGEALQTQSGPITGITLRLFVTDGTFPFSEALSCATVGSRVVTTGTASGLFGEQALGLDPAQTLVVVADIALAFPSKANGTDQIPQAKYPSVVLAPNGRPGLTFADSDVPEGLGGIALKQGNGTEVAEGDQIIANIMGVVWNGKTTFLSSWENNAPMTLAVSPLAADGSGMVPGLLSAVVGQKVGSQLLVVASGADSFPTGTEPTGVSAGDTVVFVVDILGISPQ